MIKISIAGTGKIVEEVLQMFRKDFKDKIEVTGIYAREKSVEHAIDLCEAYATTAFVFTDFDRMLAEAEADFVYIANANHVHFEYAVKAMQAGHHVIVEKPLTLTRVETEQLYDTAIRKAVFCLPAFSLLYMPLYEQLTRVLPQLGTIHMVECNYSQYSSRYDNYLKGILSPAFDPENGGGALMDINIYNLCFTIGLFGPPRTIHYMKNIGHNGVDTSGTLLCHYPTFIASLTGGKDTDGPSHAIIQGERGYICVDGSVSLMKRFSLHLRGQEPQVFQAEEHVHRLKYEFDAFCSLISDRLASEVNIPYLSRVALEISIALDRCQEIV